MLMQDERARSVASAELFRSLHSGPDLLVLTNAWDGVSAAVMVGLGAKAVATSSAAVAWSHGHPDGNALPVPLLIATLRDIARVVSVPITADIEAGYSDDPRTVGDTVGALIDVGVVGINIEDGAGTPDLLCRKIELARRAADRRGVPLFINARTDVILRRLVGGDDVIAEAISRAARYTAAGADGIFVPAVTGAAAIETMARGITRPLNVMARPGLPAARELHRLGVRRLSAAAWLARVGLKATREAASTFLATGDSDLLAEASGPMVDYNALFPSADQRSR